MFIGCAQTKDLGKQSFFLVEEILAPILWGQNFTQDLLVLIMKPIGLKKDEL